MSPEFIGKQEFAFLCGARRLWGKISGNIHREKPETNENRFAGLPAGVEKIH